MRLAIGRTTRSDSSYGPRLAFAVVPSKLCRLQLIGSPKGGLILSRRCASYPGCQVPFSTRIEAPERGQAADEGSAWSQVEAHGARSKS